MPGLGSFSSAAAAAIILLCFQSVGVRHARFIVDGDNISERHLSEAPTGEAAAFRNNSPAFDGKVDIFLDLACLDSAAAWPTMRRILWEYEFRTKIVFHILPMPRNQMAFDTAKAVQVVQLFSTNSDEVALFIDAMFNYHPLILDGADDGVARLGFRGILTKWAMAAASITEDEFESTMETSEIDLLVRYETGAAARLGVHTTPTALVNGNFMVRLIGAKQLTDFRLLFAAGMGSVPQYGGNGLSISEPIEGRWILDGEDDMYYSVDGSSDPDGAGDKVLENAKSVMT